MTTRLAAPTAVALALTLSSSAAAARIQTDHACYASPSAGTVAVMVSANRLDASQPYSIAMDGAVVATGTTDATGAVATTIKVPRLGHGHNSLARTLVLTEGANTATTTFGVARVTASFSPTVGSPRRLRVRFTATGFALQKANPTVYLHEIEPGGHLARTISLGDATGPCGTIASTKRRRLFARTPRHGTWQLQFDTSRAYHRGRSSFVYYTLAVAVSS